MAVMKLEGLAELDKALADLQDVAKAERELVAALRFAGKPVREKAAEDTPVGKGEKSGLLKSRVKAQKQPFKTNKKHSAEIHIGAKSTKKYPVFYAWFVEFGTKKHKVALRGKTRKKGVKTLYNKATGAAFGSSVDVQAKPKPFLAPAFDKYEGAMPDRFFKDLFKRMQKAMGSNKVLKSKGGR